jgi:hypothetical protein
MTAQVSYQRLPSGRVLLPIILLLLLQDRIFWQSLKTKNQFLVFLILWLFKESTEGDMIDSPFGRGNRAKYETSLIRKFRIPCLTLDPILRINCTDPNFAVDELWHARSVSASTTQERSTSVAIVKL